LLQEGNLIQSGPKVAIGEPRDAVSGRRRLPVLRRGLSRAGLRAALFCVTCCGPLPSIAAEPQAVQSWPQIESGYTVLPELPELRWRGLDPQRSADFGQRRAGISGEPGWSSTASAPALLHIAHTDPDSRGAQVFVRPQLVLGGSSEVLGTWLRAIGISASKCQAPLMKMHSTFAGSNSHAKVSLSAHCTVH